MNEKEAKGPSGCTEQRTMSQAGGLAAGSWTLQDTYSRYQKGRARSIRKVHKPGRTSCALGVMTKMLYSVCSASLSVRLKPDYFSVPLLDSSALA